MMTLDPEFDALRQEFPGAQQRLAPLQHRRIIEDSRATCGHTINYVGQYPQGTCLTHALALDTTAQYRSIAGILDIFAGRDFCNWLVPRLTELAAPTPNCLALYFDGDRWEHAGLVDHIDPLRITSKWGEMPIYDHAIHEVPLGYGNEVRFFDLPSQASALEFFLAYARSEAAYGEVDRIIGMGSS